MHKTQPPGGLYESLRELIPLLLRHSNGLVDWNTFFYCFIFEIGWMLIAVAQPQRFYALSIDRMMPLVRRNSSCPLNFNMSVHSFFLWDCCIHRSCFLPDCYILLAQSLKMNLMTGQKQHEIYLWHISNGIDIFYICNAEYIGGYLCTCMHMENAFKEASTTDASRLI